MLGHLAFNGRKTSDEAVVNRAGDAEEAIALNDTATAERADDLRPQVTGQDALHSLSGKPVLVLAPRLRLDDR